MLMKYQSLDKRETIVKPSGSVVDRPCRRAKNNGEMQYRQKRNINWCFFNQTNDPWQHKVLVFWDCENLNKEKEFDIMSNLTKKLIKQWRNATT